MCSSFKFCANVSAQAPGSEYLDVASRAAEEGGDVASRMSIQASAAATAAMEAAKLNVWKAEVMSTIEGLRLCSEPTVL